MPAPALPVAAAGISLGKSDEHGVLQLANRHERRHERQHRGQPEGEAEAEQGEGRGIFTLD